MDKRRILIVDANKEPRTPLSQVLGEFGHEVVATGNREEALAREDLEDFDLIISDLTEDADGGVQILSEIKRKRLVVPVVVSSEDTYHPGLVKAFRMGAANYLRRPYDKQELQAIVEKTLGYKPRFVADMKGVPVAGGRGP